MKKNLIVVDDFYNNPLEVRDVALSMEFSEAGNYPGLRTSPLSNDPTKEAIQSLLGEPITDWFDSGRFQVCTAFEKSWIHSDFNNDWAAIVFLSPEAPIGSGTSFYRHRKSATFGSKGVGEDMVDLSGNKLVPPPSCHFSDMHEWELIDRVGNKFNRLVIFNSSLWHISDPYFGGCKNSGRLFQLFFMS